MVPSSSHSYMLNIQPNEPDDMTKLLSSRYITFFSCLVRVADSIISMGHWRRPTASKTRSIRCPFSSTACSGPILSMLMKPQFVYWLRVNKKYTINYLRNTYVIWEMERRKNLMTPSSQRPQADRYKYVTAEVTRKLLYITEIYRNSIEPV